MIQSTLTRNWQTTIPFEVRKALELKPRQKITYVLTKDGVLMKPENEVLTDLYGILKSSVPASDKKEERKSSVKSRIARLRE